jgi:hypothetical protein
MAEENEQRRSVEILKALATATTQYYEAPPDRFEHARLQYEQALCQFKAASPEKGNGQNIRVDSGAGSAD